MAGGWKTSGSTNKTRCAAGSRHRGVANQGGERMGWCSRAVAAALLAVVFLRCETALAQKHGGTLKISFFDNPASMSLLEEATGAALRPMMGVFNNLVIFNQHVAQNSPDSITPDLATSWAWSEDGRELRFPLRQGVKWHD